MYATSTEANRSVVVDAVAFYKVKMWAVHAVSHDVLEENTIVR